MSKPFKISSRIRSFSYAFRGLAELFRSEHNSWIHLAAVVVVVIAGLAFHVSSLEWVALVTAIGLVFVSELVNSAVERAVDLATKEHNPIARQAKDLAAGAVLFAAIIAVIIAALIFIPKIFPSKKVFTDSLGKVNISHAFPRSPNEATHAEYQAFKPEHKQLRGENGKATEN